MADDWLTGSQSHGWVTESVLPDTGPLDRSKRGTWGYYRVRPDALASLAALIGGAGA